MSIEQYREQSNEYITTIESYGGTLGYDRGQIKVEVRNFMANQDNLTDQEWNNAEMIKNSILASFLAGTNKHLYNELRIHLYLLMLYRQH